MRFSHIPLSLVTATVVLTGGFSSSFEDGFFWEAAIATAQPLPSSTQPTTTAPEVQPFTLTGQLDSQSTRSDQGSYFNTHSFEGIAGQSVVIEMDGTQFDSVLVLQDPSGQKIAENDDSQGGTNSRVVITLPTTGRYTLVARSYSAGGTGNYTLSLQAASPTDFALAEADRLNQQGVQQYQTSQFRDALQSYQQALVMHRANGDRAGERTTINNIGAVYQSLGQYPQALEYYQQALVIIRDVGDHATEGKTINNIGLV